MEIQLDTMLKLTATLRQSQPPFLGRWVVKFGLLKTKQNKHKPDLVQ
jgi:hypothetical protein